MDVWLLEKGDYEERMVWAVALGVEAATEWIRRHTGDSLTGEIVVTHGCSQASPGLPNWGEYEVEVPTTYGCQKWSLTRFAVEGA